MADNTVLNSGTGGDTIATDDIAGIKHQRVKVQHGADGSATDVSAASPMPVELSDGTDTALVTAAGELNTIATAQPGVDIGDVDVLSVVPGVAATNLGKAEDAAHTSGDTGVMSLGVRNDTVDALAGANGDYAPFQVDALGGVRTLANAVQSALGVNSSTTPLGSSATFTGTGEQNDLSDVMISCFTDNTGTLFFDFSVDGTNWRTFPSAGFAIAASIHEFHIAVKGPRHFRVRLVNDAGAQTVLQFYTYFGQFAKPNAPLNQALGSDSDALTTKSVIAGEKPDTTFGNVGISAGGSLKIDLEEINGVAPSLNTGVRDGGTQRVTVATDDLVPVTGTITASNTAGDTAHGAADAGNPVKIGGAATAALPTAVDEGDRVDASLDLQGQVRVTNETSDPLKITDDGSAILVDGSAVTQPVGGDVAHDTADSGNPLKIGAVAESTENAAVADGDRTNLIASLNGKLVIEPYAVPERSTSGVTAAITGTGDIAVIAAPGAGLRIYVTHLLITNSHATVGTLVEIKDGTTVIYRGYAREDGGGWSATLPKALQLTANTALNAANATTGSNTYVSASGYIAP